MSSGAWVYISNNPLSTVYAVDPVGHELCPWILRPRYISVLMLLPFPGGRGYCAWLKPAKEGKPAPTDRWLFFARQDCFLDRPGDTETCKKDPSVKTLISS